MINPNPDSLEFILQNDIIENIIPKIGQDSWQILYDSADHNPHRFTMWCALLKKRVVKSAMTHDSWDLSIGQGRPGFSQSSVGGKEIVNYHRFGLSDSIRPLVIYRSFDEAFPKYVEIDEEFRLYHDLAEDKIRGILLSFDSSGREIEVILVQPSVVKAKLKYLRQFQAGTGFFVAIYIDSVRYSKIPLSNISIKECEKIEISRLARWRRNISKSEFIEGYETISRVLCKVILPPPPREDAGVWPFNKKDNQRAVAFIIGVDKEGNEVEHTSDPAALDNYFGANPGAPHYLTPVYFRREVLAKYYLEPERYEISDGRLTCLGIWSCQIDNDLASHVVVFLGDLGRDLPYAERLQWRQFNVAPEGGVSETNFRRSIMGQFVDADAPDLSFRYAYADFIRDWEKAQGWSLFLHLSPGDAHLLKTVRIPVTNSQGEFDEQIGHLTKLLVDSLNEKELAVRAGVLEDNTKGIGKLASFFELTGFPERLETIQLLRDLWTLRSTGTAHRKGSAYEKIAAKLGIDPTQKTDTVRRLLKECIAALRALRLHYCGSGHDANQTGV